MREAERGDELVRLSAASPVGEVVLAYAAAQVAAIKAYDPRVRLDEPDAIHQMRVATRRLRSLLHGFGAVTDRDRTKDLDTELRWLAAALGAPRDSEVLRDRLENDLARLPADLVRGPVRRRLTAFMAARYAEARTELLAALDGARYAALSDGVDGLLADPPLAPSAARPAGEILPRLVRRAFLRLAEAVQRVEDADEGPQRDAAIHDARKAAKRTRYLAEALVPVFGTAAQRFARRLAHFQDLLGDHQDSVVARAVLVEIAEQANRAGEESFTLGVLHARETCHAHAAEGALHAAWRHAAEPGMRRWMG